MFSKHTLLSSNDREMTTVWLQLAFGPGGPFETIYNACNFRHRFRYHLSLRTKRDPASFRLIDTFIQCKCEQNDTGFPSSPIALVVSLDNGSCAIIYRVGAGWRWLARACVLIFEITKRVAEQGGKGVSCRLTWVMIQAVRRRFPPSNNIGKLWVTN